MNCVHPLIPVATGLRAGGWIQSGRQGRLPLLALGLALLSSCKTAPQPVDHQPLVARFFLETRAGEGGVPVQLPISGVNLTVGAKPVLVEYDIAHAEVARVDLGRCLRLQLTPAATRDFHRLSVAQRDRRLVLFLNDVPLGARRIDQPMADGVILVFVEVPDAELVPMVERLKQTSAAIVAAARKK